MTETDTDNAERSRGLAGELREYARGELAQLDHNDLSRVAGLIDDEDVLDLLLFAKRAYERRRSPDDPSFWATEWAERRVERYATHKATRAIERGNMSQLAYLLGDLSYQNDISGMHTIRRLEEWLIHDESCRLIYLAGLMGHGKTDWALSMLQTVYWHFERLRETVGEVGGEPSEVPVPDMAANFRVETPGSVDIEVGLIDNYDDLVDWAECGTSEQERWYIFDEASTELTAQSGANAQNVAETMAPFVKKMRKNGVNMIVVGHDKGDVHVAIRSIADFVAKPGKKAAAVYSGIKNREPVGHRFDLDNIPQTEWDYDTDDMAAWSWGSALDEAEGIDPDEYLRDWRNERIAELYVDDSVDTSDLSKIFGISERHVRRIASESDREEAVA